MMFTASPRGATGRMLGMLVAAGAMLAACGGGAGINPGTQPALPAARAGVQPTTPPCSARSAALPGSFVVISAFGTVKAGQFVPDSSISGWVLETFKTVSKPTPSPRPTAAPKVPVYYYYGTFTLQKRHQTGCMILATTQDGSRIFDWFYGKFNAEAVGLPKIDARYYAVSEVSEGTLSTDIANLSATGGGGSITLHSERSGAPVFDTGKIRFVGRILVK